MENFNKIIEFVTRNLKSSFIALVIVILVGIFIFPNIIEMLKISSRELDYSHKVMIETLKKQLKISESEKKHFETKYNMIINKNKITKKENSTLKTKVSKLQRKLNDYNKLHEILENLFITELMFAPYLSYNIDSEIPCVKGETDINTIKLELKNLFFKELVKINKYYLLLEKVTIPERVKEFYEAILKLDRRYYGLLAESISNSVTKNNVNCDDNGIASLHFNINNSFKIDIKSKLSKQSDSIENVEDIFIIESKKTANIQNKN